MKRRNTMTAAVFLLAVAAGFLLLATSFFGGEGKFEALLKAFIQNRDVMAFVDGAESAVNGDLDRDHLFIQLYGGVQRLSGRRVVEDAVGENTVVRLSTGGLNFVDLQAAPGVGPQVPENAAATAAFSQDLEALGIPYLYVNAPQKLQRGEALLPTGVEEYGNESADAFLAELERQGTDYVDLRPLFEENGIYSNWFFCTDHHWKPEAAFFAWQALTDELEERYGLAADPALTDPANWDTRVLEHFFLGSQGKRVGSLYAGADDITLYTPKFDSELTYSCPAYGFTRTGPFETSVCFPERVAQQDWFNGNPYTYYAGGDYPIATITNHKNPDGPRVVLLRDSFACNFNILIAGMPRVMGVREILEEWTAWRMEGVRRRTYFVMKKKQDKLHLLKGLKRILLDIDRAIQIIRDTEEDAEVVPNLMIGFGIDEVQAEYVADIRLRNINKEYILKRIEETSSLEQEIADLQDIVNRPERVKEIIISELANVKKKYAVPRRTALVYEHALESSDPEEDIPDYPVNVFLSREGYFKKITPQSLRMSSEQKYKEGDGAFLSWECGNRDELLVFTDKQQCYKTRMSDFDDAKASVLGDYLPTKLGFDEGESFVWACIPGDYSGNLLFFFQNGKAARVELSGYQTQTRRKRLTGAYSDKSPLVTAYLLREEMEMAVWSTEGRALIFHTASLAPKATRSTQGVNIMTLKPKYRLEGAAPLSATPIQNAARYRARSLPVAGALLREEDRGEEQMSLMELS